MYEHFDKQSRQAYTVPMPKPKKERVVSALPAVAYFKPQGIPMSTLAVVTLALEEYEALRLCDHTALKHEDAALRMNVSRPTFTRIIESAHRKIAEAIVEGKAIRIEGGSFGLMHMRYACMKCSASWDVPNGTAVTNCPSCGDPDIMNMSEEKRGFGRHRHGRGGHFSRG